MHIGLLKELGPKLLKYLLSGIVAAFILIIIVGITTRYYHYNDNSFPLIRYGYSLYKEELIDEINWTRVGDKFMVRNVNDTLRMYKNDDIRMYNSDCITDTIVEVITTCNTYTLLTVHLL